MDALTKREGANSCLRQISTQKKHEILKRFRGMLEFFRRGKTAVFLSGFPNSEVNIFQQNKSNSTPPNSWAKTDLSVDKTRSL